MNTHTFRTYEGNQVALAFSLRREGIRGVWDVSTASTIRLEVTNPAGADLAPISALSAHPDANWAQGLVVVVIDGANVTAAIGTYRYALTVTIAGQIITAGTGQIEVLDRPGFAPA